MSEDRQTVLCVDDEKNILNSLKRLLRKEDYRLLTSSEPETAFELLKKHKVQIVISDQRMPGINGTEFLAKVKAAYPDIIRIILTGYTDVDSITESINTGNIYKFFLKPWNDQNLKLEIRQALEQYDLLASVKDLHKKVLKKNKELEAVNENLEDIVKKRTQALEIQNQALELSRAILEDLPFPIVGVSAEGMIVFTSRNVQTLFTAGNPIEVGKSIRDLFNDDENRIIFKSLSSNTKEKLESARLAGRAFDIDIVPLTGRFHGDGVVMTFYQR